MDAQGGRIMEYTPSMGVRYYNNLAEISSFSGFTGGCDEVSIHDSELGLPRNNPRRRKELKSGGSLSGDRTMYVDSDNATEIKSRDTLSHQVEGNSAKRNELTWLDIVGINQDEILILERALNLHPLSSEDIILVNTREKCETFQHYCLTCLRFLDREEFNSEASSHRFYLIIMKDRLVSISTKTASCRATIFRRMEQLSQGGISLTPEWISYLLIDEIVDNFVPMIRYVEVAVESLDDLSSILKGNDRTDMMLRASDVRKKTNNLLKNLSGKSGVVKALMARVADKSNKNAELKLYFADVREQIVSLLQDLMYFERTLARARKNYLAQVLIDITNSSQEVNDAAMRMTTIACITFPLNVITGLFGMNVKVPGDDAEGLWWFLGILGVMGIITIIIYYYARSKNVI